MRQDIAQCEIDWKVERRVETCIDALVRRSSGEKRGDLRIAMEDLAHCSQMRVDTVKRGVKIVPEGAAHIWKRIQANAVEVCCLHPPHCVLNQIARDQRIFLVQVGHGIGKPAVGDIAPRLYGSMRINQLVEIMGSRAMNLERAVKPIRRGRIEHPRMLHAKMIGHQVDHQLHIPCVQRIGKMAIVIQRAEVRIHRIKIGGCVAVVRLRHTAIGSNRRCPKRRNAELLQVIQMLFDPGEVAAMPAAGGGAIVAGWIARLIAVGEAIGHDQVKHIG